MDSVEIAWVEKGTKEKHRKNSLIVAASDGLIRKDSFVSWERK